MKNSLNQCLKNCYFYFITVQQAMFLKGLKCNLQSYEFVVLCKFAEDCSFLCKVKRKGFTGAVHKPLSVVIYFRKSVALNKEHENLVISDCLKHDYILVHTF
jgi:hypothetical protein